ncbi:MAG: precorrin-2 C(20)-methyltransferase [Alphaproteobacteria bacterium]
MTGTLYGLGIGPGDPELITLKAHAILRRVPVIAYPAPEHGESLARRIVATHLPGGQAEIAIRMPLDAARFPAREVYDQAASEIGARLAAGDDVAALCEGDPFLYGSFAYLFARLADTHRVEVVPGVSSLTAAAAAAAQPLALRSDVLTVIPAPLPDDDIADRLQRTDGAVIMKLGRHLARIRALLDRLGLLQRAHYVEHATMAGQKVLSLNDAPEQAPYFSLILVAADGAPRR